MTPQFDVIATRFQFVEAPRVDDAGVVYLSDLTGGGFCRVKPGAPVETLLSGRMWIGGAVLDEDGSLVVSGKGGLMRLDPNTGQSDKRLWRSVKYEDIYLRAYENGRELQAGLTRYFDFYNRIRLHQTHEYQTPDEIYFAATVRESLALAA